VLIAPPRDFAWPQAAQQHYGAFSFAVAYACRAIFLWF
jgi:hypothetical protein